MKKYLTFFIFLMLLWGCTEDITDGITTGNITGNISDNTTGEPVPVVNVLLQPGGQSTITGSDGNFSFSNLMPGEYSLEIYKEGYETGTSSCTVQAGSTASLQLLISRIPSVITVDREILDFGDNRGVVSLSFNIVNSSYQDLIWYADHDCEWIKELKPSKGTLPYGKTETITVVIDRDKLQGGENETVVVVKSSNGSSQIIIKATGEVKNLARLNILGISNIGESEATFEAEITDAGEPPYTERGFVYHTSPSPTVERTVAKLTAPVNGDNRYSCTATRLTAGETYYVRAYAVNPSGTAYSSNEMEFVASAQSPQVSTGEVREIDIAAGTALLSGIITAAGEPPYTERGFVYATHNSPTTNDNTLKVNGSGTGSYSALADRLQPNSTYFVKAYVIQNGKTFYGNTVSFTTQWTDTRVNTSAATDIDVTGAMFNGMITEEGNPPYSEKGFCYRAGYTPTINDHKIVVEGSGSGNFSAYVDGLDYRTTYFVRAYAIQDGEVIYGSTVNFTTLWTDTRVSTSAADDITTNSARLHGRIDEAGNPPYETRGFCYSNRGVPTTADSKISVYGSSAGNYSQKVTGLAEGETYYVRAFAIQNGMTIYGNTVTFETYQMPEVRTDAVTNLTSDGNEFFPLYSVKFNGTILSAGSPAYTERGFVFSTTDNPVAGSGQTIEVSGTGTGRYSATVTDLPGMQYYYVRAYAKTDDGYVYGETVSFNTYNR